MLADKEMFDRVEDLLRKNGSIERFEKEYGKIKGRMMITETTIPEGLSVEKHGTAIPIAFEASFDFYESTVGLAIYTADRKLATDIWFGYQEENAEPPAGDWVEFFVKTLITSFAEDGSYGVPIYSFVNDTCDMTVVPRLPDDTLEQQAHQV